MFSSSVCLSSYIKLHFLLQISSFSFASSSINDFHLKVYSGSSLYGKQHNIFVLSLSEQDVFSTSFLILKILRTSDPFYISKTLSSYIKYMEFKIETLQLAITDILPSRYVSSVQVFTYLICLCLRNCFRFILLEADELFTVISTRISDYILKCLEKKFLSDFNSFLEIGSFCLPMPSNNQLKKE